MLSHSSRVDGSPRPADGPQINKIMDAIYSIRCSACGKIQGMRGQTPPKTSDQIASEAVRAGWGYSIDSERLILICSYPCGKDVMNKIAVPRKRTRTFGETAGAAE
jgi:hypothetical protein